MFELSTMLRTLIWWKEMANFLFSVVHLMATSVYGKQVPVLHLLICSKCKALVDDQNERNNQ